MNWFWACKNVKLSAIFENSIAQVHLSSDTCFEPAGTVWTATAHVITAIVGSGVLTLPWSVAQLGWILGPVVLFFFAFITYFTATLLSDCYQLPDPTKGKRNHTYMDAIRACLGTTTTLNQRNDVHILCKDLFILTLF